jgi:hypothetical protein
MKYFKYIIVGLLLILSFILGVVVKDIPGIKLDLNMRLFEPLSFILTALIGISIPFFIKRWIDDSRQIKNNLIDEIKETLREVSSIKDKIKFCYHNKSILQSDKAEINVKFEESDLKIKCLEQQFIESYNEESKLIRKQISDDYMEYWKLATGSEIMSNKFKVVSEDFYRRHNECFAKLETKMKQAVNKVHRF